MADLHDRLFSEFFYIFEHSAEVCAVPRVVLGGGGPDEEMVLFFARGFFNQVSAAEWDTQM